MAYIALKIGYGPKAWHIHVSDIYGDPAKVYGDMTESWEALRSAEWCPERKPKGWWWRKHLGRFTASTVTKQGESNAQ